MERFGEISSEKNENENKEMTSETARRETVNKKIKMLMSTTSPNIMTRIMYLYNFHKILNGKEML